MDSVASPGPAGGPRAETISLNEPAEANQRLAVLIDADNADPGIAPGLLAEISKFGVASVKRIYGDWTTPQLGRWKGVLLDHSIQPIQQFAYTSGKNATDSAMIIDAMDLLYAGTFSGFCLVSSDSDFTRLAARIRESGKRVYGFGERKTPRPFVTACDQFVYTEIFKDSEETPSTPSQVRSVAELRSDTRLVNQLRAAVAATSGENGWAHLGAIGNILVKQSPDFDPRLYGYAKLGELVEAVGLFVVDRKPGAVYVSDARRRK